MSGTLTRQRRTIRGPALPHLVGLDGLRAVAVLAVVLYHADVLWLPGGFLGVDVFFVLSGFLITSLLLVELDRTGGIDFKRFYLRRTRRLLPALLAVLAVTGLLVASIAYDGAAAFRRDLPGALFYLSNWLSIFTDTSYFDFIGRPPMLKHLWSLAVEEQFYILWPAITLVSYRLRGAAAVGLVALSGALLSTLAMVIGSLVGDMPGAADPSRLYFGTDTHSMGVFVGAALAVVWRPGRTSPVLARQARLVITAAGAIGLLLLVAMFVALGEYSTFLYRGGFLVVALCSAVVVAAASHRGVPFGRWLGMRPMRWVGDRSYGIYLWHWPLFLVTRPGADLPVGGAVALVLRLALLLGIAELSYRYLELPVRRGVLARSWRRLRDGEVGAPSPIQIGALVAAVAIVLVAGFRVIVAPSPVLAAAALSQQLSGSPAAELAPLELDFARQAAADGQDPRARATAFGDSVLLGASGALESHTFNLDLDAQVATQAADVLAAITDRVSRGDVRDTVIVHVGSNGIMTEEQLRGMLTQLAQVPKVVLVNVRVPRPWMRPNNALIATVAEDYPNVTVVDWAKASEDHRDYLVKDGVHLTDTGAAVYTALIAAAAGVELR